MKKVLSLLVFSILVFAISATAFAADIIASGYCGGEGDGTNLGWALEPNGTLTISGEGTMADYSLADYEPVTTAPWGEYSESIEKLVIENGVTTIGNYAFYGCPNISGDTVIPASIEKIGDRAFRECGTSCFIFEGDAPSANWYNEYYGSFDYDETIYYNWKSSGWYSYDGYIGQHRLYVYDNGKTELRGKGYCGGEGDGTNLIWTLDKDFNLVISGKGAMKNYHIYNEAEYGYYLAPWAGCCSIIKSITIENGITHIGDYSFCHEYYSSNNKYEQYSKLEGNIIIPNSVKTIGEAAFADCSGFTGELKIPTSVTAIGYEAFANCSGFTGELVIPSSVTTLGDGAFRNCSGFTGDLVLPRSLTVIDSYVFSGCTGLDGTLTIPRSATEIGSGAFENCSGFTGDLVIPENVERIYDNAFSGCIGFNGELDLPESLHYIYDYAFYNCSGLTGELILPSDLWDIDAYAFSGCSSFTGNLVIPENTNYIYEGVFENCSGFTGSLTVNVREISAKAFSGCTGLDGYLTIGKRVQTIGEKAFENCNLKGKVTFGENLTHVGDNAFSSCENLKEFEFLGEAPIVVNAEYENRSFPKDAVLYYNFGWDYWTSPEWEGYTAYEISDPDAIVTVSSGKMSAIGKKTVSVTLSENSDAMMVQFVLRYDPAVLKVVSASAGSIVPDAEINTKTAGMIRFVWDDIKGIAGGGELLNVEFEAVEGTEQQETYVEFDYDEDFIFRNSKLEKMKIETGNGIITIIDIMFGDLNGDGKINVLDANLVRRYAAKLSELNEKQMVAADVSGDGKVNVLDANLIRRYAAKLIDKFLAEE